MPIRTALTFGLIALSALAGAARAEEQQLPPLLRQFLAYVDKANRGIGVTPMFHADHAFVVMLAQESKTTNVDSPTNVILSKLQLSDDQKKQISKLEYGLNDDRQAKQSPERFPQSGVHSIVDNMDDMHTTIRERLSKILSDEQKEALRDYYILAEGLMALRRPQIASKLELSEAQQERIRAAIDADSERAAPLHQAAFATGSSESDTKRVKEINLRARTIAKELEAKIVKELNPKQIKILEGMLARWRSEIEQL